MIHPSLFQVHLEPGELLDDLPDELLPKICGRASDSGAIVLYQTSHYFQRMIDSATWPRCEKVSFVNVMQMTRKEDRLFLGLSKRRISPRSNMPPEGSGSKGMDRPAITVSAFGPATGLLSNSARSQSKEYFL